MNMDDVPARTPTDAGPPGDGGHITVHGVLVRGSDAHFDQDALQGVSAVEAGAVTVGDAGELERPERWWLVWLAVSHEADGRRGYRGAAAAELVVDVMRKQSFRDRPAHAAALNAALRGEVALEPMTAEERAALRLALVREDPDAWDAASSRLLAALPASPGPREQGP
jgi:hypothetical protein